MMAFEQIIIMT